MVRRTEAEPEPEATGPVDRDERLGDAIEAYLELAEAGNGVPEPEEFARGYPDIADDLVSALEGLALVRGLVGSSSGPGHRLEEGRRVAGYRIVRELGRGGMGIVYEAVHVGLDRPVALKVLGTQAAPDSSGRRRFLNEARTAAGLHHTHIVPVFDVGQVGGLCYYAMQRIEGSGLDRVLRHLRRDRSVAAGSTHGSASGRPGQATANRPKPTPNRDAALAVSGLGDTTQTWGDIGGGTTWRREPVDEPPAFIPPRGSAYYRWVADVGRQAAEALAHAHQRGVIHRDIKPSNLLIDGRGMVWVADFGLARRLADPSQTQFDSMLGTPRYMSPEQARTGAIDGRADVYSLGATLYELVTLRPPFDGQSAAELIEQITGREVPRPGRFDPRVPLDLETILLKALAKRPDDRYTTADDLADDLARYLAHEPVKARRIGPVGRLWRFARRHPSLTAVSTIAAALVLSTATFAYVRVVDERDRADDAARAATRAQLLTEEANRRLLIADRERLATMLASLEKHAANVLLSKDANRRSTGLELLRQAAAMGPAPALRGRLRDQALAFLSMRDVEARPPIAPADKPPHGLIFLDNGRRIVGLSDEGELGIWDVARPELFDSSRMPIGPARGRPGNGRGGRGRPGGWGGPRMAPSGDHQVVVIQPDGGGVRYFDVAMPDTPALVVPMKGHHVNALLASDDGQHLVTVVGRPFGGGPQGRLGPDARPEPPDEPRVYLWDRDHPEAHRATLTLPAPKLDQPFGRNAPTMLAIAPDGSRVAAARFFESTVSLWDGDGMPLPPVEVQGNATALALGPAGLLAVAGNGGEIALWDLSSSRPKQLRGLGLHQSFVDTLRFRPKDGSILAASGMGGGVELWDLTTHDLIAALPTREVEDLVFSADGRTLAAGQSSSIALWSVVEPIAQDVLPESGETPRGLAFGPEGLLAITSIDANQAPSALRLWEGPDHCPRAWDQVKPWSVGFDGRGRLFALEADALRWFEPADGRLVAEFEIPSVSPGRPNLNQGPRPDRKGEAPPGRAFSRVAARTPDGRTLLISRPSGPLVWREGAADDFRRLDGLDRIEGAGRGPLSVLDPAGSRVFYLTRRGEELVARSILDDARRPAWPSPDVSQATGLAISQDGSTLAVAERSGAVLLVDAARGTVRDRLSPPADDAGPIESLAFSPDGLNLALGFREHIRLWALDGRPRPVVRLPGHRGSVRSLAFARGGRLAGADEKTVKVWDLGPLRAELARLGLDW